MNRADVQRIRNRLIQNPFDMNIHSACGEYNCNCHRDMADVLNALEAAWAKAERQQKALEFIRAHECTQMPCPVCCAKAAEALKAKD